MTLPEHHEEAEGAKKAQKPETPSETPILTRSSLNPPSNIRHEVRVRRTFSMQSVFVLILAVLVGLLAWRWVQNNVEGLFSLDAAIHINGDDKKAKTPTPEEKPKKGAKRRVEVFYDGVARYSENDHYGYIRQDQKLLTEALFDDADIKFFEGMAWVQKGEKYGFVDKESGDLKIPIEYDDAERFKDGFAKVVKGSQEGKVSKLGKAYGIDYPMESILRDEYFKTEYAQIGKFNKNESNPDWVRARVRKKEGLWGFINREGDLIIPAEFEEAGDFKGELARVRKDGKYAVIDMNGDYIVPAQFDEIMPEDLSGFLLRVKDRDRYGYYTRLGVQAVNPLYEDAGFFSEGVAYVKKNGKYGFIDEEGKLIIPVRYDEVEIYEGHYSFKKGRAKIRLGGRQGYVYRNGEEWWYD